MFPESFTVSIAQPINDFVDWLVINYGDWFELFSDGLLVILVALEGFFRDAPWWFVLLLIGLVAYGASRSIRLALGLVALSFLMGVLGLWDEAMQTLALMLVATSIAVLVGLPFGILLSRSDKTRVIGLPILDAMQTLPSFVYLIPALMLFGLGKVPAIIATVIYAVPPVIRLTDLGLRQVNKEVLEAADAFGATPGQRLWKVELPLALPSIMAGINQATMMALSMVVIASMIGNRGLGQEVLLGINTLDVGRGAAAGLAIVAMAIVLDRTTQAYARRIQISRGEP
ncbi:MAG: proline/glycine betaine ABC transporter permease [Rhodospirillaceae bacterium]|jgi:glycine betaine/proline transport system permease protein|nr:proline/glycine betaine ABC transporter permease [Rhodospirillaceae bacterium]MBT5242100.1 proline/glycine betaine ABC transporter permease [Rhodospirillaceae bacterium]MBT5565826.1 proline/glycine betaine ABC transporter permease [Rhodospirillaceae bacterium]MBT6090281.1 proline/glycine betaine ABC transporter permease [Rhodospirillaceae bacterium]MBT6961960.1 proline/glycine betaine ABC transporter permease [Rhodospirillaceae bacterium]